MPPLPKDFLFGFATAAYQIEGSPSSGGRTPSVWDTFSHTPGKVADGSTGDEACDHYNRWKEDLGLVKEYGANAYRLSVSWSRVVDFSGLLNEATGKSGGVGERDVKGKGRRDPKNEEGIKFYRAILEECVKHGIKPAITLFHWDTPQALEDRYGGWRSREMIEDFVHYAKVCFEEFGDLVKHWITLNEPWCYSALGHAYGVHAPGRTSDRTKSPEGDSAVEPYIVAHNLILGHAYAVQAYRTLFAPSQGGSIGITLDALAYLPWDDTPENKAAAQRAMDARTGWFADPIYKGHYPPSLLSLSNGALPSFTEEELHIVKGSSDWFGLNTYTSNLIRDGGTDPYNGKTQSTFIRPDGTELGFESHVPWLQAYPEGFRWLLNYLWKASSSGPVLFHALMTPENRNSVTENGFPVINETSLPLPDALHDTDRIRYFEGYTKAMLDAIHEDGVVVKSYFAWSLLDNFEWVDGYRTRFGVTYVDYETQKRYPKDSARWLKDWCERNGQKLE